MTYRLLRHGLVPVLGHVAGAGDGAEVLLLLEDAGTKVLDVLQNVVKNDVYGSKTGLILICCMYKNRYQRAIK